MSVITIRVEKGEGTATNSVVADANNNVNTSASVSNDGGNSSKTVAKQAVLATAGLSIGKAGFNFLTANYGNLTGDFIGEVQLQEKLEFGSAIAGIGAGFAFGGIAGGVLATTAVAINYATNFANDVIKSNRANQEKEMLRVRYGLINQGGGRS